MGEFPKDGSTFVVESIDRTAYRWAKYKPDGARQMGKPGRWQKQVWSGDWFKWENCEEPVGEIAPAMEDGPISGAVKALAAKDVEIARLREALKFYADAWFFTTSPKRPGLEWKPKELLLEDCGNIARAALEEQANV